MKQNIIERTIISGELTEAQKSCKHLYKVLTTDENDMVTETCKLCKFAVTYPDIIPAKGKKIGEFKYQPYKLTRVF